jgi:hypothetical protein
VQFEENGLCEGRVVVGGAAYEAELLSVLRSRETSPDERMDLALRKRLARSWLSERVRARCAF